MVLWPIQSLLAWLERIWKFFIWPLISQVRAGFNSFGGVEWVGGFFSGKSVQDWREERQDCADFLDRHIGELTVKVFRGFSASQA